ncbi:MAG TPA: ribosome small subunit-dependent GTPase A, partial [Actinomycetales bacterium]|nr:ribosome small subunit-dependent GTPase A [Actinomycetales bacterium]
MRYRDFDEDDVPMRPSRRGSRPRTKRRPEYSDAVPGMVTAIDRGRITVLLEPDESRDNGRGGGSREVVAIKARTLGRKALVVGDGVSVVGDISGRPDTLARIVRISKRSTTLRRTA